MRTYIPNNMYPLAVVYFNSDTLLVLALLNSHHFYHYSA